MAGDIQVMFVTPTLGLPLIRGGKIRALAYDFATRASFLPDVPTMAEAGAPPTQMDSSWHGLFAPAKTPAPILAKLEPRFSISALSGRMKWRKSSGQVERFCGIPQTLHPCALLHRDSEV
jgi:tripartite-type tricarboxylate transporter receptor subunit TctC